MNLLATCAIALCTAGLCTAAEGKTVPANPTGPLVFTLATIDGQPQPLTAFRGKVVLLVNVASRCGLTPQYAGLQALYAKHQASGLVVVGVPANQFGGQEPGTAAEIKTFCTTTYQVTFPMMAKVVVKGDGIDPLYAWLTEKSPFPGPITWNFEKFLIGRDGQVKARFSPRETPDAPALTAAIERELAAAAP